MTRPIDVLELAQALVRCPSITPEEGGALDLCQTVLSERGFETWRLPFAEVDNLFARFGTGHPHLCFAGHTDVVPVGEEGDWTYPPFAAEIVEGQLYGRGAEDMKGNVAAALAGVIEFLAQTPDFAGSLSFLLTGDEEGPAVNGAVKVLQWMAANGHKPDRCLVIEPTACVRPGDRLKVGRRGSMNATLRVKGTQGHTAYPAKADNPLHPLVGLLQALIATPLDQGSDYFEASSLQITSIDVGNSAHNVIPALGAAQINLRFNDLWTPETLEAELRRRLNAVQADYGLETSCNALAFMIPLEDLALPLAEALEAATGRRPTFSTAGGTSDARFVQAYCPVVELGLVGRTLHQVDERVPIEDIRALKELYVIAIEHLTA